jgi:hypothetical protein
VVQAQGGRVQLDVGGIAQLKVGDVLMAYKLADSPLRSVHGQQFFGFAETPTAALVVKQVQPLFATAELENDQARLNAGDVVRFAW